MPKYEDALNALKKEIDAGLTPERAVEAMHDRGLTIVQSIKGLTELFGLSLGEAKSVAAVHPLWSGVVRAAEPLHEELEAEVRRRQKP